MAAGNGVACTREDARDYADMAFRMKEKEAAFKNKRYIYDAQKSKATDIVYAFTEKGASLVTFIASPQWGKTGVAVT